MQESESTVAVTVRVSAGTHGALQGLAQQAHRSLAGQAAYLLEQALAVEQRVRRVMAAERAQHWLEQTRTLPGDDAAAAPAGDAGAPPAEEADEAGGGARGPAQRRSGPRARPSRPGGRGRPDPAARSGRGAAPGGPVRVRSSGRSSPWSKAAHHAVHRPPTPPTALRGIRSRLGASPHVPQTAHRESIGFAVTRRLHPPRTPVLSRFRCGARTARVDPFWCDSPSCPPPASRPESRIGRDAGTTSGAELRADGERLARGATRPGGATRPAPAGAWAGWRSPGPPPPAPSRPPATRRSSPNWRRWSGGAAQPGAPAAG